MKKITALSIFSIIALSACSPKIVLNEQAAPATEPPTTTAAPIRTTTSVAAVATTRALTDTEEFLNYVRSNTTSLWGLSDSEIIGLAMASCDFLAAGGDGNDITSMIMEVILINDLTEESAYDFATVIGAGVATYCPEYGYLL